MSYADLIKYGLPVAGNLIGGVLSAKASGSASDAQQKYLEEALAYQKEQDTYARTTDASRYADKQKIDAAAVQYGYDSDAYAREVGAAAVKKEATRYGDYQGRIAPFIANGVSSNDRMSALLGLPARAASAWGDGTRGAPGGPDAPGPAPVFRGGVSSGGGADLGDPLAWADKLSPVDKAKVDALLKASNSSDDPRYWYGVNAQHGGFDATGADWNQRRIATGDGVGKGYRG